MEDFDKLIKGWKEVSSDAAIENENFYKTNKTTIMESIINYEKNEKQEKQKQIYLIITVLSFIVIGFSIWSLTGDIEITSKNLIGFILLISAYALSVITNKTDDFPDARLLNSKEYLMELKQNITARRKRHISFSFLALIIVLPATYLLFYNFPFQLFPEFVIPFVVLIGAVSGFTGAMLSWRKKYDATTKPLLIEIDQMMTELN